MAKHVGVAGWLRTLSPEMEKLGEEKDTHSLFKGSDRSICLYASIHGQNM